MAAKSARKGTGRKAKRGTLRNPARGVVDLRYATPPRPNARKPFYATWYDAVNKRKGGSQPFATLPEAVQWIDAMEKDNMAAYYRGEPTGARSGRSFGEVAEAWTNAVTGSRSTINTYKSNARQLIAHFGYDTPIGSIDAHDVKVMLNKVLAVSPRSGGTAKARLNAMNQIMDSALDRKLRSDNPCRGIARPRQHEREPHIVTAEEMNAILKHLPGHLHLPTLLSYHGGLRIGEVCGLRTRDLDLVNGMVKIVRIRNQDGTEQEHAKGGKVGDWADLPDAALPILRRCLEAHPPMADGNLFSFKGRNRAIRPLSQIHLRTEFKRAVAAAGLPVKEVRFHDLRHTCATNYARLNAPAYVIQAQLRHSSLNTSQRYISKVQNEQRRSWSNIVGNAQNAPAPEDPPASAA